MKNVAAESIRRFLTDDTIKVAVLKGKWGTGKTFFWKDVFERKEKHLTFKAYSYVSLFGAKDVMDLRQQVFANFEMLTDGKGQKKGDWIKMFSKGVDALDIPYLSSSKSISKRIENKFIDNMLICFDDLERKEDDISASSILGLISQLKEEKNCKILLIYNDDALDDEARKQIDEYREKVVDLEVKYDPSIEENLSIVWNDGCPEIATEIFKSAGVNNIRVMQRVKRTLSYFKGLMDVKGKYPDLAEAFERACVALTIIHHCHSDIMPLDEVLATIPYEWLPTEQRDEAKKKKSELLKRLRYNTDEQDELIVSYLLNGYADNEKYRQLLEKKEEQNRQRKIQAEFRKLWETYYCNFTTTQNEWLENMVSFLGEHKNDLGFKDILDGVRFVRKMGGSNELEEMFEGAIKNYVSQTSKKDDHYFDFVKLPDDVMSKIKKLRAKNQKRYSINELFDKLGDEAGYHSKDIEHMVCFSVDDYFNWMTTESEQDVIQLVRTFISRFGHDESKKNEVEVVEKIREALERLKGRSEFDKLRVVHVIEGKEVE